MFYFIRYKRIQKLGEKCNLYPLFLILSLQLLFLSFLSSTLSSHLPSPPSFFTFLPSFCHPQFLSEGYAAHLSSLEFEHGSCTKKGRMIPRQASFGLTTKSDFLSPSPDFLSCKRTPLLRRAMSVQQPSPPSSTTATPKPERAQSQPERAQSQCEVHMDEVGPVVIKEDLAP